MDRSWRVRLYKEGDERGIFDLMKPEYGISSKHRFHWVWEHKKNPCGNSLIGVAECDGQIVGYMAFVLVKMKVGENVEMGCQAVELIVHPEFRRQGVFLAIEELLLNGAGNRGILITYAFPTEPVRRGHVKYGFFDICDVLVLVKCFDMSNAVIQKIPKLHKIKFLLQIALKPFNPAFRAYFKARKMPQIEGLRLTEISLFDDRINNLWDTVSWDYKVIVVRDRDYLNWRYFEKPDQNYKALIAEKNGQVLGYIVLTCKEFNKSKVGHIVDVLASLDETDIIQCLFSKAIENFAKEKVDLITCWTPRDAPLYTILKDNGFIHSYSKHPIMAHLNLPSSFKELVKDSRNWYITMGDSDII